MKIPKNYVDIYAHTNKESHSHIFFVASYLGQALFKAFPDARSITTDRIKYSKRGFRLYVFLCSATWDGAQGRGDNIFFFVKQFLLLTVRALAII